MNEHELAAAREEASLLALGWDSPEETAGLLEAIDAVSDPDDFEDPDEPDPDPNFPDDGYIRALAEAEDAARERMEEAELSAGLARSGTVEERYAGYRAAADEFEDCQRRRQRCEARRKLYVVETECAQRLLATRERAQRAARAPRCRVLRMPRRAGFARAGRSHRVAHARKTAAGDSGDPDPESSGIRRCLSSWAASVEICIEHAPEPTRRRALVEQRTDLIGGGV